MSRKLLLSLIYLGVGLIREYHCEGNQATVVGGTDAEPGEFPFQVSVQIRPFFGGRYHNCGGIILDATHIITAAHCLKGKIQHQISVVAGAHNMKVYEATQQTRRAKRLVWHSQYDSYTLKYDVGVITLVRPLEFNERVQPLRISREGYNHTGLCTNTGWGNANPTGGTPVIVPDALQKIVLEIIPHDACQELYDPLSYKVDETMLCARGLDDEEFQGSCNGDSGGPLVCSDSNNELYLAGIVSWGQVPCGQHSYPTVFADVGHKGVHDFVRNEA